MWRWDEAASLDEDRELAGEVQTDLKIILSALGEVSAPNKFTDETVGG